MSTPWSTTLAALPAALPVFPLPGAIVLPHAQLHLNIFEPRYLNLVTDALGLGRIFGMVQPKAGEEGSEPALCEVGCGGRITSFTETDDGRFLIVLTGVCRYRIVRELPGQRGYRRVQVDWSPYAADLLPLEQSDVNLDGFFSVMRNYLEVRGLEADWSAFERLPPAALVNFLAIHLPFSPQEKQAILEAPTAAARAETLKSLAAIAAAEHGLTSRGATRH